jgi:hypothetical protein
MLRDGHELIVFPREKPLGSFCLRLAVFCHQCFAEPLFNYMQARPEKARKFGLAGLNAALDGVRVGLGLVGALSSTFACRQSSRQASTAVGSGFRANFMRNRPGSGLISAV